MGTTYGRQVLETVGASVMVSADAQPQMKAGGVTVDWGTVAAVGSDTSFEDGVVVLSGEKCLRFGQVLTRITQEETQTVTVANATGGTFTVTGTNPLTGVAATTAALAFNVSAANMQTALEGIFGAGNVLVSLSGGVYTVTFTGQLDGQTVAPLTVTDSTTGAGHAVTIGAGVGADTSFGLWGPYDPAATDGRQNLVKGDTFVVNETVREVDPHSNHVPALQGGLVWKSRLLATTGAHSLAAGPTFTELEAVLTTMRYCKF